MFKQKQYACQKPYIVRQHRPYGWFVKHKNYTYDVVNRLTQMSRNTASAENEPKIEQWTFDNVGNFLTKTSTSDSNVLTTQNFSYDLADRLTTITQTGQPTKTLTYDANGNMLNDGAGKTYTWNARNQLTQVTQSPNNTVMTYDPLGRRLSYTRGTTTRSYLYDGLNAILDGTSQFLFSGLDQPLQRVAGTTTNVHLQDNLGSTTRLMDTTGNTSQAQYRYNSYGKLVNNSGTNPVAGNVFTYTGREDDSNGLYYFRNRYYDPNLERFIQDDILGGKQRYVGNNPLTRIDPLGWWYKDTNVSVGFILGITFGEFEDEKGCKYSYFGGGVTSPGISYTKNFSQDSVSPNKFSIQGTASRGIGITGDVAGGWDQTGSGFVEAGAGVSYPLGFGGSGYGYYTFGGHK
jgi:RHS repeat-associated protein